MGTKTYPKKVIKSEQNKPHRELVQPDKNYNTISEPKREMIMPREFNSLSDPRPTRQFYSQATNTTSPDWSF